MFKETDKLGGDIVFFLIALFGGGVVGWLAWVVVRHIPLLLILRAVGAF